MNHPIHQGDNLWTYFDVVSNLLLRIEQLSILYKKGNSIMPEDHSNHRLQAIVSLPGVVWPL